MGDITLVVDCDVARRRSIASWLAAANLPTEVTETLTPVFDDRRRQSVGAIVVGFSRPELHAAIDLIERLRTAARPVPVFVISRGGSEDTAVRAFRAGATDYFKEPVDVSELLARLRLGLVNGGRRPAPLRLRSPASTGAAREAIVGDSAAVRSLRAYLNRLGGSDATVLITGDTGTGKELAARSIHEASVRRERRFLPINCAAIPETLIESELFGHVRGAFTGATADRTGMLQSAQGGTVFLDEIGELGLLGQAKILRAIEEREVYRVGGTRPEAVDVRVIAATSQDLEQAVTQGRFRRDLYFRLNVARVHLPPLRERRADIPSLLEHYLRRFDTGGDPHVRGFAPDTLHALQTYEWPGNIRELKNLVESIFISPPAGDVQLADLPDAFRAALGRLNRLGSNERQVILDALLAVNWNKSKAAARLRWSRMTLYRKISRYSIVQK